MNIPASLAAIVALPVFLVTGCGAVAVPVGAIAPATAAHAAAVPTALPTHNPCTPPITRACNPLPAPTPQPLPCERTHKC